MKLNGLFLTILLVLFGINSWAQNWTGAASNDWNDPMNWDVFPQNGDNVIIDNSLLTGNMFQPSVLAASTFIPATITIQNSGNLNVFSDLETSGSILVTGPGSNLTIQSGNLNVGVSSNGVLYIDNQANFIQMDGAVLVGSNTILRTDAYFEIDAGTLSINDQFSIQLGAKARLIGGDITVNSTFTVADGNDATGSISSFTQYSGTLNVLGNFVLENTLGNYNTFYRIIDGEVTVAGNVLWNSINQGTGNPKFNLDGGIVNFQGTIENVSTGDVQMSIEIRNNATLNFSGTYVNMPYTTDSLLIFDNGVLNISNINGIQNKGGINCNGGTVNFLGSTQLYGDGFYQFYHVNIGPNDSLKHISPYKLRVAGDFTNDGLFTHYQNNLILNGAINQNINGSVVTSLNDFSIGKTGGNVFLNQSVTVYNLLNLANGIIFSDATNLITMMDNSQASPGVASSFNDGPMRKIGDDAFVFPIGANSQIARIGIGQSNDSLNEVTATYFPQAFPDVTTYISPLVNVNATGYWTLTQNASNVQVPVQLFWENPQLTQLPICSQLAIAAWDGTAWNAEVGNTNGTCDGINPGNITSANAISQYGTFTFGALGYFTNQDFTICSSDSIVVGTNVYNQTGSYIDILPDQQGLDSTIITNLTVISPIVTTQSFAICFGEHIVLDGANVSNTGVYQHVYTSASGCDSTMITTLTVQNPVNTAMTLLQNVFIADNTTADLYEWINCNTQQIVVGEDSSVFTPTENGQYALIVHEGNCSDTSACFTVSTIGLKEITSIAPYTIYPNPAEGKLKILGNEAGMIRKIQIMDISGKIDFEAQVDQSFSNEINLEFLESGMYTLKIEGVQNSLLRFVKK